MKYGGGIFIFFFQRYRKKSGSPFILRVALPFDIFLH